MTQTAPFLTIHYFTKIDTLQAKINYLTHQVDSLNKVSAANTIHTTYFHDIINAQVATFVGFLTIIITLGTLISWRSFTKKFEEGKKELQELFIQKISDHEMKFNKLLTDFDTSRSRIEKNFKVMNNDLKRSVYHLFTTNNNFEGAILWGIGAVQSYLNLNRLQQAQNLLKILIKTYKGRVLNPALFYESRLTDIKKALLALSLTESHEFKALVSEFEKIIMKEVYKSS
ncbi:hypothetical protein MTO98_31650 [Mucilaginibacter sp. SMC90]|uniref:hypothetical protein n=1 Tax=Mucilaginibacter sp. SMC90 TaxID=2929803 RepID=UPI001FB55EA9|nr:hypothetical protein [Mucilaginibacter sp. SMC90]UOE48960.1 hypothetical protein MTO98_31650 [Mucilaginibacter sp. SMC90]